MDAALHLRSLRALLQRDLAALGRELEAYPDEASVWARVPAVPNSGGALVRHVCGNLRHFVGAVLGGTDYLRNRDAEFGGAPAARAALRRELEATARDVTAALDALPHEALDGEYPHLVAGRALRTADFLAHLVSHTAFHLGQLDYHRRAVAGAAGSVAPMGVAALESARER